MRIDYRNRVFGLDMMRFLAIFLVLFAHIDPFLNGRYLFFQEVLSLFGFFGVEMFFVLSGFLIGRILFTRFVEADASLKTILYFWIRRWFRTLPNYYLVLLINILILCAVGYSLPGFEPIRDLWKYFFFAHNLTGEHIIFFPESWSLSVEEYAYIVGPIVIYGVVSLLKQHKKKRLFDWNHLHISFFLAK
jgi:peptidoglycan/LPS O-acetylase OafA/YrhL